MTHFAHAIPLTPAQARPPGFGVLLRLKLAILRNRLKQLVDQNPLQLLMVIAFVAIIWGTLYLIFDRILVFIRRFEQESVIALPYVFHLFFFSMTLLLAFSTGIIVYGALFSRDEPSFLLAAPNRAESVVAIMFIESIFFASWSLVLLGLPLMLAVGRAQDLPWHFYPTFIGAFLGFVPIPGAAGLLAALAVALYVPRMAGRTVLYVTVVLLVMLLAWWGKLWSLSAAQITRESIDNLLGDLSYLKAAMLPSTWVSRSIQLSIENKPLDAVFYLLVTGSTALFAAWWSTAIAARKLMVAFGRAGSAPIRTQRVTGRFSRWITAALFFYLPIRMRLLILKDVRNFLRDPLQWSQLAILFGLLSLYLFYLPRTRPEGFTTQWRALICFLNYGAITLILSTFTSRFVFPMMSLEGRQSWLVGLWPLSRGSVIAAKFAYAMTITAGSALLVTWLSIRAIDLPLSLAALQAVATIAACAALCGMAVGLGARLPDYREINPSRIASGLGGTVNLIASVGVVAMTVGLFGGACWFMVQKGDLAGVPLQSWGCFAVLILLCGGTTAASLWIGLRAFRRQEF